jgi:hypothetical protein
MKRRITQWRRRIMTREGLEQLTAGLNLIWLIAKILRELRIW